MALNDSITEMFETIRRLTAETVENYQSELELNEAEINRLNERSEQIRAALSEIGEGESASARASTARASKTSNARTSASKGTASNGKSAASSGAAKSSGGGGAAGEKIIAYLRTKAGQFIPSAEIAAVAGTPKVSTALAETPEGSVVERRGAGRRMEYRVKK